MIYDLLDIFKKEYEKKGDNLILDNYILKDGLYVKITKDETLSYYIFKNDKKVENKETCFEDLNGVIQTQMYDWFKQRDYYSSYLNSNKSFSDKKIHNVNYLSLFIKLESFISEDSKKLLSQDAIRSQYLSLLNYKKFTKKEEKTILKSKQEYINGCKRKRDIVKKYQIVKKNLQNIIDIALENKVSNYIKVFFDEDVELYQKESNLYYSIKIFNDIKYSKTIGGQTFGLSDSNMGLNSKKPFLELKSKKIVAPFLLLDSDALMLKKFLDFLKFQELKDKYPLNENFFINRSFKEKDLITDFDYLPIKIDKLKNKILIKNYLLITKDKIILDDITVESLSQLEHIVDKVFYNKQLIFNYFNDDIKVSSYISKKLQTLILTSRFAMINYFKKYREKEFYQVIKKYGNDFVVEHIRQGRELRAKESLNLKFSLLQHKGESVMDIQTMQENIIKKLENSDYTELKSDEFFYISGQVVKYLLSQSEKHEKNSDMMEPFLRANSSEKLKKDIEATYFKYKHKISLDYSRFNNALALIMAFETKEKLSKNMDSFLVGVLSKNIFYMKREEK